ncbi:MAG TPA: beta-L-arabinofuranosidase domain-containing protein [Bryobacteraceae bacterium]|nr:beta-L-arabinofuranosidase domain-containing protein [Bryobacteraceae bacterium]
MRLAICFTLALWAALAQNASDAWRSEGVINTNHSPYAKLHTVPVRAVRISDGFWSARMRINVERSIPTMLDELEQHGVVDNFRRLSGRKQATRRGPVYTDSDIYKWMEAVAFVLQSDYRPGLRATFDRLTDEILAAQEPSGYLNTYYVDDHREKRFAEMYRSHELYCLGHLLQAAIAYYRATGNRKLLDGAMRYADYMVENFGPTKRPALAGHPEVEMALVELYRTVGERKYLDFAGYLLSGVERERLHLTDGQVSYLFSGIPFTSRTHFEGHAVRCMYASSGATDYYGETGDRAYAETLARLWTDMTSHKMYITGGVGSRDSGEAFGESYELPNAQAYGESCAAIGNMMWNFRMLAVSGESRFADVIERALYNGINSGMSLSGTLYCYRNPLESTGEKIRNPWYETTCCPPNLERTLASLPGYFYGTSPKGVYVNLYDNSHLDWHLEDGTGLKVDQKTEYPWGDAVEIAVAPATPREFSMFVRIPGWSHSADVKVNGGAAPGAPKPGQYFEIRRTWKPGDRITVKFDMTPQLIRANPLVREDAGRVAVQRGPVVYCIESPDQPVGESLFDIELAHASQPFQTEFRRDLLDGVMVLRHEGVAAEKPFEDGPLYQPVSNVTRTPVKPVELKFIPYYAWANRGLTSMEVWIPLDQAGSGTR